MSRQPDPDRVTVELVDSHHRDDRRAPRAVRHPVDNGLSVGAWSVSTAHLDRRWGTPIRRGFTGRNRLTHYAHLRSLVTGNQLRHDRRAARRPPPARPATAGGGVAVLTIAKLGHGRVDYYLDTVAKGIEDYYAGTGEAPGTWRGTAAARLGLDGEVDGDVLRAILGGQLPGVDGPLAGGGRRRTPGWDLTFSAPKSVSVLFGLADPDVSRQVAAAHEAAVNESLTYLERWALTSRRRQGGEVVTEAGRGMIVAGFRHRTSRAGDPQLHTHALMANAVQRHDGSWGAVDSRVVYRQARSAGFVYQAVLRSQLTERLGVHWEPVDDRGIAELADVPVAARILFSKRRHQIEAALEARGLSSARAAQVAAVRTRAAKGEVAGTDVLRARWRAEAADVGVTSGDVHRAVGRLGAGDVLERVSVRQRRHVNDELLGPAGLTGQRTSFQRGEISQAWCQAIDPRTVGVTATTVDTLVESTIGDRRSVLLGADDPVRGLDRRRWSSEDLLAVEARILDRVAAGRDQGVATVAASAVRRAVAHSTLSDEQQAMVTALTRDGHHIDAVVGVAGSGKTYALSVAHRLWADAGYRVLGAAISKQAATQLQADTGITSGTLDSLLLHLDRPGAHLQPGSVVVVDEAGMVPTRKLDELLGHCAPGRQGGARRRPPPAPRDRRRRDAAQHRRTAHDRHAARQPPSTRSRRTRRARRRARRRRQRRARLVRRRRTCRLVRRRRDGTRRDDRDVVGRPHVTHRAVSC